MFFAFIAVPLVVTTYHFFLTESTEAVTKFHFGFTFPVFGFFFWLLCAKECEIGFCPYINRNVEDQRSFGLEFIVHVAQCECRCLVQFIPILNLFAFHLYIAKLLAAVMLLVAEFTHLPSSRVPRLAIQKRRVVPNIDGKSSVYPLFLILFCKFHSIYFCTLTPGVFYAFKYLFFHIQRSMTRFEEVYFWNSPGNDLDVRPFTFRKTHFCCFFVLLRCRIIKLIKHQGALRYLYHVFDYFIIWVFLSNFTPFYSNQQQILAFNYNVLLLFNFINDHLFHFCYRSIMFNIEYEFPIFAR